LDDNELLENPPIGTKPGLNYHTSSSYIFNLVAPLKEHVFLLCPDNEYKVDINYKMTKSEDGNSYWIELPKSLFEGGNNSYQYLVDGQIRIADPFAEVVLDPWNDDDVPSDVKAELPNYPETMTTGIVTAFDFEEANFNWQVNDVEKVEKSNLVIYELMMRDFLSDKNYKSLLDTLDYLENLGINAIEFMPIQEFEGNQSWGYNPSFHMAVDKYYGSRNQLKQVIDACHQRGIMVILDVVFNHAFSQSPLCQLYWDPAEFRPTEESPYLNVEPKHPFNVGYDFNHESEFTKQWVKRVLEHWITEYKFDGFRFDLSKGLTQTFSGTNAGAMSQFDLSRVNILKDYASYIWSLDDQSYVIMEHFADNSEEKVLSDEGMMMWGNLSHEFTEAAMGYSSNFEWADYTEREWNDPHLIAYMESHDEERMGYKLKSFGNSNSDYDTRDLEIGAERVMAASSIYFSIPGPKMLWQFGELVYDFSINRCVNGTISNDCRLDPKPVRWDYFDEEPRRGLYDKLGALLHLKTNYPTFSTTDFSLTDNQYVKKVHLNHADMDAVSMANFRIINSEINPQFPYPGTWYEYFTGNEREVVDTDELIDFLPGEYRIYTSEKLTPPGGFFTSLEEHDISQIKMQPNPVLSGETVRLEVPQDLILDRLILIDLNGRKFNLNYSHDSGGIYFTIPEQASSGIYVISMRKGDWNHSEKLIIME